MRPNYLTIKFIGRLVAALLMLVVVTYVLASVYVRHEVRLIEATWRAYEGGTAVKSDHLGELRAAIGYGGVIHEFKEFILNRDRPRIVTIHTRLRAATIVITALFSLDLNEREREALSVIDETVTKYESAVALAESLVRRGVPSHEIEEATQIDDDPALQALAELDGELKESRRVSAEKVYGTVADLSNFVYISTILTFLLLGLLVAAFVWFIRWRLVKPLSQLGHAMEFLASGNTARDIPFLGREDEIGAMARTVEVFKAATIERDKIANELKDSVARTRAILDTVIDGIVTIDEKGAVESFNPAAMRIFGFSPDEVIGQNVKMLMPEPYKSGHDGYLDNYITTGTAKIIGVGREVVGQRKDGSTFPMELAVDAMEVEGRRMFTGIVRDITDRKQAEQMKRDFVSTVSHELRTPLTSIKGSLGLIKAGVTGEMPKNLMRMLEIAYNNSDRLVRLINDILDIEKIEAGKMDFKMAPMDLETFLKESIEANKGFGEEHGVRFELVSEQQKAIVNADRDRLMQVLGNLLSNAAKFSPEGASVEISLAIRDGGCRVSVTDSGPGIQEEFRGRIFSKFSQADSSDTRAKGGTGLGLNITKAIVERHGGTIGFDTEVDRGTTFYFVLPHLQEDDRAPVPPDDSGDGYRVLICEDEPDIATLLEMMLKQAGFETDVAPTAAAAEEMLERRSYDVMTLDLALPDKSGITLLKELRERPEFEDLPIVVISAKAQEGREELNGEAFGVVDWIEKPIDQARLSRTLRTAVGPASTGKPRVLHVEDDQDVLDVVGIVVGESADVTAARTLAQAKRLLEGEVFDLVILDLTLPDGNGEELLSLLKTDEGRSTPVIVFSASEVSERTAQDIQSTLVKSRTSNEALLETIRSAIKARQVPRNP